MLEQIEWGNYNKGALSTAGYRSLSKRFYARTRLHHDTTQLRNRIRQLKQMYAKIKEILNATGLGRRPDGWPIATNEWWDRTTKVICTVYFTTSLQCIT